MTTWLTFLPYFQRLCNSCLGRRKAFANANIGFSYHLTDTIRWDFSPTLQLHVRAHCLRGTEKLLRRLGIRRHHKSTVNTTGVFYFRADRKIQDIYAYLRFSNRVSYPSKMLDLKTKASTLQPKTQVPSIPQRLRSTNPQVPH